MILEKRALNELKQRLELEQSTFQIQQDDYKLKVNEIDHANDSIKKERDRLSQLYYELHALDGKHTGRLHQLQKSISTLRQQEEQMTDVGIFVFQIKSRISFLFYSNIQK